MTRRSPRRPVPQGDGSAKPAPRQRRKAPSTGGKAPRSTDSGAAAVRDIYAELIDAWNRHSADDFAHRFADDALLIAISGCRIPSSSLADHLRLVFIDHPTSRWVGHVLQTRPVGSDAVMLHAIAGTVPAGKQHINPAANAVHTLIAEKRGSTWQIVLFQNAPAQYHNQPGVAEHHTTHLQSIVDIGAQAVSDGR